MARKRSKPAPPSSSKSRCGLRPIRRHERRQVIVALAAQNVEVQRRRGLARARRLLVAPADGVQALAAIQIDDAHASGEEADIDPQEVIARTAQHVEVQLRGRPAGSGVPPPT